MPLRLYDTRDLVPEAQRANAVETKDGKFAVSEDDPALGESGKQALERERAAAKAADEARKKAEKERDELRLAQAARDGNVSELQLQKLREEIEQKYKPDLDEKETLKAENRKLKLTDRVQALALKYGVMPDRIEDAMLALATRTDLGDQNGIIVKDKSGKVTAETIDDFLSKTFKAEKPWLYAGTGASGSGASGSTATGTPPASTPKDEARVAARGREVASSF